MKICDVRNPIPREVMPPSLVEGIIKRVHSESHRGIQVSIRKIHGFHFWDRLKGDVKECIRGCDTCAKTKITTYMNKNPSLVDAPKKIVPSTSYRYSGTIHTSRWHDKLAYNN
uniref:Putative LOC101163551 [Oryzias latipes] n=1 Tax=Lepeophtheirus salmonis TaxID=72036 RepID=A0A0K2UQZ0_LEPSM